MSKLKKLQTILKNMQKVLVAYSGGVDSTFLLKIAVDTLGNNNVLAVLASSETYPASEIKAAVKTVKKMRVKLLQIKTEELKDLRFSKNPAERCYYCKLELFGKLKEIARKKGYQAVVDGANYDDRLDFRPGTKAGKKLGIQSPLKEAGFRKEEIRKLSKKLKLSTWNKPSMACLASRIPYGVRINNRILNQIGEAESYLKGLYFKQVRVRHHGNLARIEVTPKDFKILLKSAMIKKIAEKLKKIGYTYITFDIEGFRSGSMNLVLKGRK
ncbi:MAG: TIGR00268 family protein [Candidatus Firestonebacteria bacterium RIFOXYA2_FULL_40_8]|nr:MAG: TIGR00268 family protein [Candidatus Firestonebacteria bacterium RIFOXYA2_FULL_40_8]